MKGEGRDRGRERDGGREERRRKGEMEGERMKLKN